MHELTTPLRGRLSFLLPEGERIAPRLLPIAGLALLLLAAAFIYTPGLHGGFLFDDGANILENQMLRMDTLSPAALREAALSGVAGPLKRPVSMLSFGINHYLTGLAPFYFKLTNLALHLATGVVLYILFRLLLRALPQSGPVGGASERVQAWVAVIAAGAWLLHPLNLSPVLYVVQRMALLAGLFVFAGLACYVKGRLNQMAGRPGAAWLFVGTLGFGALAVLSKENGVLLPLLALVCEFTILRFRTGKPTDRTSLYTYHLGLVLLPAILLAAFIIANPGWLAEGYQQRHFSLYERMLTQGRVLWFYLAMLFAPRTDSLGLFHDDMVLSTGLLSPSSTLWALLGLLALGALALSLRRRLPLVSAAILWFFAAHLLESTILPLEMVHEHRNYVAGALPLLAVFYSLLRLGSGPLESRVFRGGALAVLVLLGHVTWQRVDDWSHPLVHAAREVENHPHSARAQYQLGRTYYTAYGATDDARALDSARHHFELAAGLGGHNKDALFALIHVAYEQGREPDPAMLERLRRRLSSGSFRMADVGALRALVLCQQGGGCRLSHGEVLDLFGSALANPTVEGRVEGTLVTWLASYYANVMGMRDHAAELFRMAVELDPGIVRYRLNLVEALLAAGRAEEAAVELGVAEAADALGAHASAIADYHARIARLRSEAMKAQTGEPPSEPPPLQPADV